MVDPATKETLNREYTVNLPANYKPGVQYPVILWFHGWYDDATYWPFIDVGQKNDVITVYPLGMSDVEGAKPDDHSGISWNVGDGGNTATCSPVTTVPTYYKSCRKLDKISKCNCFTCYDDVAFVRTLISKIKNDYCVDDSKLYVTGASNGGMFTYYLVSQIPELVNGYLLMFGAPMIGWLNTPSVAGSSYLLALNGRSDTCIPPAGGMDESGWMYETLANTFYVWGLV